MSDLISRQGTIDRINEYIEEYSEIDSDGNHSEKWCAMQEAKMTIKNMPSAQPERKKEKWIPCSERLPDEKDAGILKKLGIEKRSEDVLATVEVKGERMTVTTCTYDGKWEWDMKYAFPDYKVIAWMPLPEPFRGEKENETY